MAKQSLAAQTGTIDAGLRLPSIFTAPIAPVKARYVEPYITFAHPKRADEWAKLQAKFGDVTEGSMYLVASESMERLDVAKVSLLACRQYWAHTNASGTELLAVSFDEMPRPFKEHIEAVVLVYFEDRIVPANVRFRSTKCPAAKTLSDALIAAAEPTWASLSSQHKETLVCQQPFMRFYGNITIGPPRTSKSTGLPYRPSMCSIKPTGVPEWRLLKALIDDPETQKHLEDAGRRYEERIAEVSKKVK